MIAFKLKRWLTLQSCLKYDCIRIEPASISDAPRLFTIMSDPGVANSTGFTVAQTIEDVEHYISGYLRQGDIWCIWLGDEIIGAASYVYKIESPTIPLGNLGIFLGRSYQHRGIGSFIMEALLRYIFVERSFEQVTCCAFRANALSYRLIQRYFHGSEKVLFKAFYISTHTLSDFVCKTMTRKEYFMEYCYDKDSSYSV